MLYRVLRKIQALESWGIPSSNFVVENMSIFNMAHFFRNSFQNKQKWCWHFF